MKLGCSQWRGRRLVLIDNVAVLKVIHSGSQANKNVYFPEINNASVHKWQSTYLLYMLLPKFKIVWLHKNSYLHTRRRENGESNVQYNKGWSFWSFLDSRHVRKDGARISCFLRQLPALLRAAEIQAGNDREKWDVGAKGGRISRWARRTCQRKRQTSSLPRNGDSPKTFWKDRRNVDEQDGSDLAQIQI